MTDNLGEDSLDGLGALLQFGSRPAFPMDFLTTALTLNPDSEVRENASPRRRGERREEAYR
jgi:hypothetical protein